MFLTSLSGDAAQYLMFNRFWKFLNRSLTFPVTQQDETYGKVKKR